MKFAEIQQLTDVEIRERIAEEKMALQKLRFAHAISPVENPNKIHATRKTIARLFTELTNRESSKS